ncbi:MAG: hypothetical protein ACSHYB_15600 [Roseibacillus sp.]
MDVLALTILVSLILAVIFLVCFTCEIIKPRKNSLEHTSLLPLDDEPVTAPVPTPEPLKTSNPKN